MKARRTAKVLILPLILVAFFAFPRVGTGLSSGEETAAPVKIGVLAYRGKEAAFRMWSETGLYLTASVPGRVFLIVPLDFVEIGPAVRDGAVDFVITNSYMYADLEARYGVSRISTLENKRGGKAYRVFGSVIFCRADRGDIHALEDLQGKSFMAVEDRSLGGWLMAWRELKAQGIDPYNDFASFSFGGTHDAVVYAVLGGKVDAGTVRTDTLERMEEEGRIDTGSFRILNQRNHPNFPFAVSTPLYPEWPIAKLRHADDDIAKAVAMALMAMPSGSQAAEAARISGWTIPLDYGPVHELMKELRIGPYESYGVITRVQVVRLYWKWFLVAAAGITFLAANTIYVRRLNKELRASQRQLEAAQRDLEKKVRERTADLVGMNEELEAEIAERTRAEAEKERLQEQLLQTQKMEAVGLLAGGIAHDFNNILTAIIGYGNILEMKLEPDSPQKHAVHMILASSERAANLTRSLLAFSRKQIINPKPLLLNSVVKDFEGFIERVIGDDIEFSTDLSPEDLVVVADRGQIEQVLMNFATNARDSMPNGGSLHIQTREERLEEGNGVLEPGRYALLSVTDTGTGLDEETKARVFEPFFTTKETGRGTGLGLAMAYGIIRQHNGFITVESTPGKGSTFSILLPLADSIPHPEEEAATEAPLGGSETILLAEDNEEVRRLVRDVLTGKGYRVIEARDGKEAVECFAADSGDIALLLFDVLMPRMNGREAYEAIARINPGVCVLFTSGYTANVIHKAGILDEGLCFLTKPLEPKKLLRRVREILDRKPLAAG